MTNLFTPISYNITPTNSTMFWARSRAFFLWCGSIVILLGGGGLIRGCLGGGAPQFPSRILSCGEMLNAEVCRVVAAGCVLQEDSAEHMLSTSSTLSSDFTHTYCELTHRP